MPSLPGTGRGTFVAETMIAVFAGPAATGEATGVDS